MHPHCSSAAPRPPLPVQHHRLSDYLNYYRLTALEGLFFGRKPNQGWKSSILDGSLGDGQL